MKMIHLHVLLNRFSRFQERNIFHNIKSIGAQSISHQRLNLIQMQIIYSKFPFGVNVILCAFMFPHVFSSIAIPISFRFI